MGIYTVEMGDEHTSLSEQLAPIICYQSDSVSNAKHIGETISYMKSGAFEGIRDERTKLGQPCHTPHVDKVNKNAQIASHHLIDNHKTDHQKVQTLP